MEPIRMDIPRIKVIHSDFAKSLCVVCLFILFLLFAYFLIGFSTPKSNEKNDNDKNKKEDNKDKNVCNCNCKFDTDQKK